MHDYWVVIEKSTGKVVAHCGEEKDAVMMILLNHNRIYKKQKFILDQVIDIKSKINTQLPGQNGLPAGIDSLKSTSEQVSLPESQANPIHI